MSDQPADKGNSFDLHRVLVEIDEEVRAKRASGELSSELERELDAVFARFAPAGAIEGDFDQLLARAEQQSYIDLLAPNESVRPGVPQVKRVVQKTIRWYLRYVTEQLSGFAHTITKAVGMLAERVDAIDELRVSGEDLALVPTPLRNAAWDVDIVQMFKGANGRILHARCGSGDLVAKLAEAGIDAYGVDPDSTLVATGTGGDTLLDLRPDDERRHMRTLSPGVLGGLVLSGSVDVLPVGAQLELVDLAAVALMSGAKVIVTTTNPDVSRTRESIVASDLAPGRPLHAETWAHLLSDRGFVVERIDSTPAAGALVHVPGTDESSAAMNANIDRLNSALFPPDASIVIARR